MSESTTRFGRCVQERTRTFTAVGAVIVLAAGVAGGRATLVASSPSASPAPPHVTAAESAPVLSPESYSAVVDRVAPAVVTVRVEKKAAADRDGMPEAMREFFGPQFRATPRSHREGGLGSGVVVRADGYVLTNHHVVSGADTVRVDLADGRSFPAKVVGSDAASDLAVLRINATGLPTVPFGDSDRVRVGDVVLAFGNPLGVGQTVTMGIVSAKGRTTGVSDGNYEDFLQTDAPINQGNSGGALVNLHGELVGVNAQILSPSGGNIGLGFAIPSSMARMVSEQLTREGVVHRAKLGVTVQPVTPELAQSLGLHDARGALVSSVEPGGPGERAGLRQGDVITTLDGAPVSDANALRNHVASSPPDSLATIGVLRQGASQSLTARLAEREAPPTTRTRSSAADSAESGVGMAVARLTPDVAGELGLPANETGLVVTDVDPDGSAAAAGLQPGDVIRSVNGRATADVAALRAALDSRTDTPALVLVTRRGGSLFLALSSANP